MLGQHGELGRVYLVPEDPLARKRRKQAGRNSGKNFTEGWVEFEDKRVAKQVLPGMQVPPEARLASLPDHASGLEPYVACDTTCNWMAVESASSPWHLVACRTDAAALLAFTDPRVPRPADALSVLHRRWPC